MSPNTNAIESQNHGKYGNNIELMDLPSSKIGTTIGEEAELMNLLEEMPSDVFKE